MSYDSLRRFAQRTDDPLAVDVRHLLAEYDEMAAALQKMHRLLDPPTTPTIDIDPSTGRPR